MFWPAEIPFIEVIQRTMAYRCPTDPYLMDSGELGYRGRCIDVPPAWRLKIGSIGTFRLTDDQVVSFGAVKKLLLSDFDISLPCTAAQWNRLFSEAVSAWNDLGKPNLISAEQCVLNRHAYNLDRLLAAKAEADSEQLQETKAENPDS